MVSEFFKRPKTVTELEEENERLELEEKKANLQFSIAQKKAMSKQLQERGLTAKHFGFDWGKIYNWLKTH